MKIVLALLMITSFSALAAPAEPNPVSILELIEKHFRGAASKRPTRLWMLLG